MEIVKIKCSSKDDKDIDAISYCGECKIYMCNKCEKYHSKLHQNHQIYNLDKQIEDIFTGFCKEENHPNKLEFFCKNHNTLCCAACLCKISKKGIGLHKDCDVCLIEDIKDEKNDKIKSNIKYLEEISNTLQESINNMKIIFEKIIKNKEDLKLNIQNIFTKIKNVLNSREDELLIEVDKQFDNIYCNEKILEQCKKLPNKIKLSLEKSKNIEYNEDKLSSFINECINIENNIKEINIINDSINKCKNEGESEINFIYEEQFNSLLENIKKLGKISIINKHSIFYSLIINNENDRKELIINWIKQKTNKSILKFEKIFTMSINGTSCYDFHKYCDNKGPTLTLVKTTNNKIFGGFTPLNWESLDGVDKYDKNNQTFIFSLNSMKKFDMINKEKSAIYCNKNNGPYFGGRDFSIESDMKKCEAYANQYTNFLCNNNLELIGEKGSNKKFNLEDFEVFKIIFK